MSAARRRRLASLLFLVAGGGCGLLEREPTIPAGATADLNNAVGQPVGTARFTETGGGLTVELSVRGLLEGFKAVHIHEIGKCLAPGFESAGEHFNPHRRKHGLKSPAGPHAGDLPNVVVGEMGRGKMTFTTGLLTLRGHGDSLLDGDGAAIVVHAGMDDDLTDPAGGSGGRLACGVIVPAAGRRR